MKIVFSTDQMFLHGGIEKVLTEKANYFANSTDFEVFIITTEQNGKEFCYPIAENITLIDLKVNYNRSISYFHPKNLLKIPKHFFYSKKVLKQINPNVLIVSNYAPDFYWTPFILKNIAKCKEYHGSKYFENSLFENTKSIFFKIKFRFENWIASKYDRIIVLNEDEKKLQNKKNTVVIPNSISINETLQAELNSKLVITAGRIAPVKGYDKLIEAWLLVKEKFPDWKLHIYGDNYNNTKEVLNKMLSKYALQNEVVFKGTTPKITNTMTEYSIFVMSSQTECFPMVLLESLSVGLPIVSFDCETGPRNIITNNVEGVLIENQNSEALANGLVMLMKDFKKRENMGKLAKKKSYMFSTTEIMQQWNQLFLDLSK